MANDHYLAPNECVLLSFSSGHLAGGVAKAAALEHLFRGALTFLFSKAHKQAADLWQNKETILSRLTVLGTCRLPSLLFTKGRLLLTKWLSSCGPQLLRSKPNSTPRLVTRGKTEIPGDRPGAPGRSGGPPARCSPACGPPGSAPRARFRRYENQCIKMRDPNWIQISSRIRFAQIGDPQMERMISLVLFVEVGHGEVPRVALNPGQATNRLNLAKRPRNVRTGREATGRGCISSQ